MSTRISHKKLVENSESAMLAAIEIYNKPRIAYRDEIFVQLLINSWELLLKAVISRHGYSIHYRKKRNEPRKSLSFDDCLNVIRNNRLWPKGVEVSPTELNLGYLKNYRDQSVHFYGDSEMSNVVYSLAVASIQTFQKILVQVFDRSLQDTITWELLPLSFRDPRDIISVLKSSGKGRKPAVQEFVTSFSNQISRLHEEGSDVRNFAVHVDVSLESKKNPMRSDLGLVVSFADPDAEAIVVERRLDPNLSHPFRQKEAVERIRMRRSDFNARDFQAVTWNLQMANDPTLCWIDQSTNTKKWSQDVIAKMVSLSEGDLLKARERYSASLKKSKERRR